MNTEQVHAEFEAWLSKAYRRPQGGYSEHIMGAAFSAGYQAGRAALQSQQQDSLVALKQMQRYFGKWPEFVPADEHQHNAIAAIKTMNDALAGVALQSQPTNVELIGYVEPLYVECRKRGLPLNSKVFASPTKEATKAVYSSSVTTMQSQSLTVDALAQEIRRVNGNNALGAGALAEALMPFLESALQSQDRGYAVERLIEAVRNYMSFGCPVCSGDCFSANPPVSGCPAREAQEAIDHARRIEGE